MKITAAILVIGNEILSGRTQDKNINFLATKLTGLGITLSEVRIVPDIENKIISAVNELSSNYSYVFTSGGIGPTHDDITSASIATARNKKLILDETAHSLLKSHYKPEDLNEARLKMAYIPEGAKLIKNPISKAPGFVVDNIYVMAGVPMILEAMFEEIKPNLKGGELVYSETISTNTTEGVIASELSEIQSGTDVEIGSYPFFKDGKVGVSLVIRSPDKTKLSQVCEQVKNLLKKHQAKIF